MTEFFIPHDSNFRLNDHRWDGYTLVLPCISVGNVPQLAVDLLVNSLLIKPESNVDDNNDLRLIGYIRSRHVYPFAGPDPFTFHGPLFATSIQVFASDSKKLIIIQQRSPIYKEFRNDFYAQLSNWISRHHFSLILLLSSSFDHYLIPDVAAGDGFCVKYLAESNLDNHLRTYLEKDLALNAVEPVDPHTMKADPNGRIHLPGSGSARAYLKSFGTAFKKAALSTLPRDETKIICLVMFCSEGDNRSHAFKLADKVAFLLNRNQPVLKLQKSDTARNRTTSENGLLSAEYMWSVPFSWRTMFGDGPPSEIF